MGTQKQVMNSVFGILALLGDDYFIIPPAGIGHNSFASQKVATPPRLSLREMTPAFDPAQA